LSLPEFRPRRPLVDSEPKGYMESDTDFLFNNLELALRLLEAHGARVKPPGATHWSETYHITSYFRKSSYQHLNQVSESWQPLSQWHYWDLDQWVKVEAGFSSRRLRELL